MWASMRGGRALLITRRLARYPAALESRDWSTALDTLITAPTAFSEPVNPSSRLRMGFWVCTGEWCEVATVTPGPASVAAAAARTLAAGMALNTIDGPWAARNRASAFSMATCPNGEVRLSFDDIGPRDLRRGGLDLARARIEGGKRGRIPALAETLGQVGPDLLHPARGRMRNQEHHRSGTGSGRDHA